MKKKVVNKESITKDDLEKVLRRHPTKDDLDNLDKKFEERFVQFKSDIFTRFDEVMGELAQIREDRIFTDHDVKVLKDKSDGHEKRIKKLETHSSTS